MKYFDTSVNLEDDADERREEFKRIQKRAYAHLKRKTFKGINVKIPLMPKKTAEILCDFLKIHGCFEEFIDHFTDKNKGINKTEWVNNRKIPLDIINDSFIWRDTKSGFEFWVQMSCLWKEYYASYK